jgi:hypothetical protein
VTNARGPSSSCKGDSIRQDLQALPRQFAASSCRRICKSARQRRAREPSLLLPLQGRRSALDPASPQMMRSRALPDFSPLPGYRRSIRCRRLSFRLQTGPDSAGTRPADPLRSEPARIPRLSCVGVCLCPTQICNTYTAHLLGRRHSRMEAVGKTPEVNDHLRQLGHSVFRTRARAV